MDQVPNQLLQQITKPVMKKYFAIAFLLTILAAKASFCQEKKTEVDKTPVQETAEKNANGLVVIKGSVVLPSEHADALAYSDLPFALRQRVELAPPPLPPNWETISLDEQNKWWDAFIETESGKEFIAAREKIIADAKVFNIRVEDDGRFIVYDVPPGTYALQGRVDKTINNIIVAFEVFGQLEVLEKTDELMMGALEIYVTPLFKTGDSLPNVTLNTLDGQPFSFADSQGHPVLLLFWSVDSPPSLELVKSINGIANEMGDREIEFVTISLDVDSAKASGFLTQNTISGTKLTSPGWDSEPVKAFGIRGIPSLWLLDANGKVALSNNELSLAIQLSKWDFKKIFEAQLDGNPIDNYPPKMEETQPAEGEQSANDSGK